MKDDKIERILDKIINIDENVNELKRDNDYISDKNKKLLIEIQKLQKQRDKQLKWVVSVLITFSIIFILSAILIIFLGNSYQIFGISELYNNVNYAIKNSENPLRFIWYSFYFIPYVLLGILICLLYGLADRYK